MASAYMYGGGDDFVQLMIDCLPADLPRPGDHLDRIAQGREDQIRELKVLRRQLKSDQDMAKSVLAAEKAITDRLNATKSDIERQVRRQEALLNQLEGAEARRQRLAREARARASRDDSRLPIFNGPASGRARIAIQQPAPSWASPTAGAPPGRAPTTAPGLTMWAWAKAGVSLPHSSRAQYNSGRRVSRNQLQPGDLVFFGSPIHHVGLYIGGGRMIAAPQSGDVVKISSMNRRGYAGAVRL